MKLLVDGFTTKITHVRQELRMLVHPSSIDLSSRTLRFPAGQLSVRQAEIGRPWRGACQRVASSPRTGSPAVR